MRHNPSSFALILTSTTQLVDILHWISDFPLLSKEFLLFADIGIAVILVLTTIQYSTDGADSCNLVFTFDCPKSINAERQKMILIQIILIYVYVWKTEMEITLLSMVKWK